MSMMMTTLRGCGLGLRREHYETVLDHSPPVPWFEVISENFMVPGGRPLEVLDRVRRDYPVALHGVSLSVGSDQAVDRGYLEHLRALVDRVEPAVVSDHLCWAGLGGHNSHDLLPLPFTQEAVTRVAHNVARVQDALGRRILLENVSTYLRFREAEMAEWEFVAAVAAAADCGLLLDVNNVYVNARNHGFDPAQYLAGIPAERVGQIHLAGHEDQSDAVVDTHDRPVRDEVWELYRQAVRLCGPVPTLIERDAAIPPLADLLAEAQRAEAIARAEDHLDAAV